tara:strand:+ start:139 stop:651 length:513 start_codon:yes stop_codon:yes gene_type:complete
MSAVNYDKCLETILHHEGGYVNHPEDPGGETNMGVTKRVYDDFGGTKDMKDLEFDDVAPIYKQNYWDRVKGDHLPIGLDLCVFDFGVNAGTGRSAKYLQALIGTTVDGGIGPNTLKAVDAYVEEVGIEETIRGFQQKRQDFYESLDTFKTFGKGWTRRVDETTELAISMT